ncbi:hypothetical protein [Streptomyces sp. NPDC052179]|uniref:hypothetical protein n=1 Tax=Streptomyces sp. NPDC052179 TaxID=3155680 RepID=UPI003446F1F8
MAGPPRETRRLTPEELSGGGRAVLAALRAKAAATTGTGASDAARDCALQRLTDELQADLATGIRLSQSRISRK